MNDAKHVCAQLGAKFSISDEILAVGAALATPKIVVTHKRIRHGNGLYAIF